MRVLLLSTFVYLTGVAVVLFLRPALMFRLDGTWKEFGLGGGDASPFPFWLFCMTWAIASFFLSRALVSVTSGGAEGLAAAATALAAAEDRLLPLAPPANKKKKEPKPGYYRLNSAATKKDGVPRYVYVGPELPGAEDSESDSSSEK